MSFKIKAFFYFLLLSIIGYVGWRGYYYFFDKTPPTIALAGIVDGGHYGGDVHCTLSGSDVYKVATISVVIDNEPFITNQYIGARAFEYPFVIKTADLKNGEHQLAVTAVDSTYTANKTVLHRTFNIDNIPLQSAIVRPIGDVRIHQGKTIHMQLQVNKPIEKATVQVFAQEYPCFKVSKSSPLWECFVPIACEQQPDQYTLAVKVYDAVGNENALELPFQVIAFPFKTSKLTVDQGRMEKEIEMSRSQQELEDRVQELLPNSPQKKLWTGTFYPPIEIQRKTTEFGTIRTTQLRGRYMHKAVDVINAPKSVVWAPQDGIVVLKDRFAYSGNTVVIDHGFGVFTLLFHLDTFADINVGDTIRRGNPVGTLGMTGYASGYHLHWEMRVNNVHVDPEQWTDPKF